MGHDAEKTGNEVRRFFGRHAGDYAQSPGHARGSDLARLLELLEPNPGQRALDVATGTGFTALALAERVREVVGIDLTEAMLNEAQRLAVERGLTNVSFLPADVAHLPFPDGTFDLVTCRRAAHHFAYIPAAVREMVRVLRPGGRLGLVDMCPPAGAGIFFNAVERLRDPSHQTALDELEWQAVAGEAGLDVLHSEMESERQTLERWLYPVAVDGPEAAAVRRRLAQAAPEVLSEIGYRPDEGGSFIKRRLILIAVRRGRV